MITRLHRTKLRAVAEFARFCVRNPDLLDDRLIPQTLGIAVRKLHDFGESDRGHGKYTGHSYWSRDAHAWLQKNGGVDKGIRKYLTHEHVIPVKVVVAELLRLSPQAEIRGFEAVIQRLSLVAIITREEDSDRLRGVKLKDAPDARWFESDRWWRYRKAGLLANILDQDGKCVDA